MLRKWLYRISGVVQWHPWTWRIAWAAVNRLPMLPAHDPTYYALRHFCVKEDGLFLDIGANCGVSARSFRKMNRRYRILSIEPNRMHAGSLERMKRKTSGFDYLLQGAGAEPAQFELYTPYYGRIALHTCAALSEAQVHETVRQFFGERIADRITVERQSVQILPIDQLGLSPDIIKIDVEGFELNVLAGARQTIRRARPFLMLEACFGQYEGFVAWAAEEGFDLLDYLPAEDRFVPVSKILSVEEHGAKNVFAVPREKRHLIPVR